MFDECASAGGLDPPIVMDKSERRVKPAG